MKKIFLIAVFVIGLMSASSCRSTSRPCGLAEKTDIGTKIEALNYTEMA